jgi:hypothetical protein
MTDTSGHVTTGGGCTTLMNALPLPRNPPGSYEAAWVAYVRTGVVMLRCLV